MTKKIVNSVVLASVLMGAAHAATITPFGQVGIIGNVGLGNGNTTSGNSVTGYLGVSAHIGVDFNFSGFRFGLGAMAGFAPLTFGTVGSYGSNTFVGGNGKLYERPYVDLSDFYIGYQGGGFGILAGRYNGSKILSTADWIGGYNQGLAIAYQSTYFNIWATWVNDYLQNGYNASANLTGDGRYGMDLSGFSGFTSSWQNFNIRNELFALGADVKIGEYLSISPYAHYWLRDGSNNVLQAGGRVILSFNVGNIMKSTTTGRVLWSHMDSSDGIMWQAEEELLFINMIKIGGGYMSIGNIGLNGNTIVDRTRFYGQYLYPYSGYNATGLSNRGYLNAGVNSWYVFAGLKFSEIVDLDILYADGDYKEFSTIINWNIINANKIKWSLGGGFVSNGFGNANSVVAFTKLKF